MGGVLPKVQQATFFGVDWNKLGDATDGLAALGADYETAVQAVDERITAAVGPKVAELWPSEVGARIRAALDAFVLPDPSEQRQAMAVPIAMGGVHHSQFFSFKGAGSTLSSRWQRTSA